MRPADAEATGSKANTASPINKTFLGLTAGTMFLIENSFLSPEPPGPIGLRRFRTPVQEVRVQECRRRTVQTAGNYVSPLTLSWAESRCQERRRAKQSPLFAAKRGRFYCPRRR